MLSALIIGYGPIAATRAANLKAEDNIKHIAILDINPQRLNAAQQAGYITFSELDLAYQWLQDLGLQEFDIMIDIAGIDIIKKSEKPQIVYIALDYDGCGCHLFLDESLHNKQPAKEKIHLLAECNFLINHLKYITKDKKTVLCVGSNRQDQKVDQDGQLLNKNGSCFKNFNLLTRDMCAAGLDWEFNKLLLSDIISRDGEDITILRGQGMENGIFVSKSLLKRLHPNNNINTKLNTIELLLWDAAKNHPDAEIAFYFYDDDVGINDPKELSFFEAFKKHFTERPKKIPVNVTLFLMHFDAFARIQLRHRKIQPTPELQYWSNQALNNPETEMVPNKRRKTLSAPR